MKETQCDYPGCCHGNILVEASTKPLESVWEKCPKCKGSGDFNYIDDKKECIDCKHSKAGSKYHEHCYNCFRSKEYVNPIKTSDRFEPLVGE